MGEIRKPVRPVMVSKLCDSCEEGTMSKEGDIAYATYPPRYDYQCNICGAKEILSGNWPRIEYVEEGKL